MLPVHAGRSQATLPRLSGQLAGGAQPKIWWRPTYSGSPLAEPVRLPSLEGLPAELIRERVGRIVAEILADDSGSEAISDPRGSRYAAALSLVGLMRRHGGGRMGVLHWGSACPAELALAPVDIGRERRTIKRALSIPGNLGGTNVTPALIRAAQMLPALLADDVPLIYVITDGITSVDAATHTAVANLPAGSVHVLLNDTLNGCTPELEAGWRSLPIASFTRLDPDTRVIATRLAELLAGAIGARLPSEPDLKRGTS